MFSTFKNSKRIYFACTRSQGDNGVYATPEWGNTKKEKIWIKETNAYNSEKRRRQFPRWQVFMETSKKAAQIREGGQKAPDEVSPRKKIELIDFLSCLTKLRKFYGSLKN